MFNKEIEIPGISLTALNSPIKEEDDDINESQRRTLFDINEVLSLKVEEFGDEDTILDKSIEYFTLNSLEDKGL